MMGELAPALLFEILQSIPEHARAFSLHIQLYKFPRNASGGRFFFSFFVVVLSNSERTSD